MLSHSCLHLRIALTVLLSVMLCSCSMHTASSIHPLNLSFEQLDSARHPNGWFLWDNNRSYIVTPDSNTTLDGHYAIRMEKADTGAVNYSILKRLLPIAAKGDSLTCSIWVKTENVKGRGAVLWMRTDSRNKRMLGLINAPQGSGVSGTHDWTKVSGTLPIDPDEVAYVSVGVMFSGTGRIWVDRVEAAIDGHPLEKAALKDTADPNDLNTLQTGASAALAGEMNEDRLKRLSDLGMLWGFLKYYHPAIGSGKYDWDSALFRILPPILHAPDDRSVDAIERDWVRQLGKVRHCAKCSQAADAANTRLEADYGALFSEGHFSPALREQLAWIRDNHTPDPDHYYVGFTKEVGNPVFRHEHRYESWPEPPPTLRLLALYRYWNMIQYYYPYRYRVNDWDNALTRYIPAFLQASGSREYLSACFHIIGDVRDTHANIYSRDNDQDSLMGLERAPFTARFAEGKAVVTGYIPDSPDLRHTLPVGTVIRAVDDIPIDSLVKRFQPLTPASNYAAQLRNMTSLNGFLWRMDKPSADFEVQFDDSVRHIQLDLLGLRQFRYHHMPIPPPGNKAFQLLGDDIGYIKPSYLKEHSLDTIRQTFAHTRGLIIDLRCYPTTFMPFTFGAWLKEDQSPFVYFSTGDAAKPGRFLRGQSVKNGGGQDVYKGKLIIIVDASTQSQAEYTAMALQTVPGALVIGSTTAGADGNVSGIFLPGDIFTYISGIGVYYPDGKETQGDGVHIDIPLEVTIKGISEGRDEFLEKAISLIRGTASR